jgi:putative peptidoglycan lipid II flippase
MSLITKFASVGGATMASRVLGFVREMMIAAFLGTGPIADAFYAAFRFPNLFRRLFAEGAFNAAFIPLFAKRLEEGEASAKEFARDVISVLIFILLIVSALAIIFMPWLVGTIIAPKFAANPEKFDITILLTRVMFPYLAAMSLVAMLSGILNSLRKYFLAAFLPVLLNIVLIGALALAGFLKLEPPQIGLALAIAVTISGFLQLALVAWGAKHEGYLPLPRTPKFTAPVRRLLWLALPAALTGGITQINLLVGQIIASAEDGAIAVINIADRLIQLPLGVIGIAIGVVLLPELARSYKAGKHEEALILQSRGFEFALFLTLPAAVGLAVLTEPIVSVLFERGAFDEAATLRTSAVLTVFALGLPAFVLSKVFTPAYYVDENMRWPMWCSLASVIVNITGSLILFPTYGVVGIGISTAASGWVNALMLMIPLMITQKFKPSTETKRRTGAIIAASVIMGIILFFANDRILPIYREMSFVESLASVIAIIGISAIVYFGLAMIIAGMKKSDLTQAFRK